MPERTGFPSRMEFTPVPSPFLGGVLHEMTDLGEVKCALRVFWHLHRQRGRVRLVTLEALLGDRVIVGAVGGSGTEAREGLRRALAKLEGRGVVLVVSVERDGERQEAVLLDTLQNRQALASLGDGGAELVDTGAGEAPAMAVEERPNIFQLYEENMGLLTPLIAEELKDAEQTYPEAWIREAFAIAARQNTKRWSYVARILQRWAQEGKDDGESGRHSQEIGAREYLRRYGAPWRGR